MYHVNMSQYPVDSNETKDTKMATSIDSNGTDNNFRKAAAIALGDVDALGLTGDDRRIVLTALLKARFVGATVSNGTQGLPQGQIQSLANQPVQTTAEGGDLLGRISTVLKVERDLIELVYAIQDGEPTVVVSAKKIASNKSQGTKQLAQLVSAARQITGLEEWTSSATIRAVATDFGRINASNFAATLQQMDKVALIRGRGQQREIKITKPGIEDTAELIKSLTGSE